MQTYSEEISALSKNVAEWERDLRILNDFILKGGQYRIHLAADHSDPNIKETIERLAADEFPASTILQIMLKRAEKALQASKEAVFQRAAADALVFVNEDGKVEGGAA